MSDSEQLIHSSNAVVLNPLDSPAYRDNSGRFIPGVSGNPLGKPKQKLISDALRNELEEAIASGDKTKAEGIAQAMVTKALNGHVHAAEFVRDTTEGKPVTAIKLESTLSEGTANRLAALAEALLIHSEALNG